VFPIVGGRKIEHLHGNIKALDITLTLAQIQSLEEVIPFEAGFPHFMIVSNNVQLSTCMAHQPLSQGNGEEEPWLVKISGHTDKWPIAPPLNP
jgi:hypothetical protein